MLPVVFIHGLIGPFADERALSLLQPAVALTPDLLGYGGEAGRDPADITIESQLEHLHALADRAVPQGPVQLVAHSVGGVIAASFAHRFPDRVASFVNVEGNFTLADAFWSAKLADMAPGEVQQLLESDRRDPARWLRDAGVQPTPDRIRAAAEALAYQPATTIQATARWVVDLTGRPTYERLLREVFNKTPVHLVAGTRSRAGWNVPGWALQAAASYTEIPDVGHMVMLEAPEVFGETLVKLLRT